jgi:hypothetical protein
VVLDEWQGQSGWYLAKLFDATNKVTANKYWLYPESEYSKRYNFSTPSTIYYEYTDGLSNGYLLVANAPENQWNQLEFNSDHRIVVVLYNEAWPPDIDDIGWDWHVCQIKVSKDYGASWTDENIFISQTELNWDGGGQRASIAEDGSGNIWCVIEDVYLTERIIHGTGLTNLGNVLWNWPGWDDAVDPIMYVVMKWVEGSGATAIREIVTTLVQVYLPPPDYDLVAPGYFAKMHSIAAEDNKIAVNYLYSYTIDSPVSYRYFGSAVYKMDISLDGGGTWNTKTISVGGYTWKANPEWSKLLPGNAISGGVLISYLVSGTYASPAGHILRSTDNGDTWSIVKTFAVGELEYPWVCALQSRGAHVTFTGCAYTVAPSTNLAFWESHDSGATWAAVEVIPTDEEQILVPV